MKNIVTSMNLSKEDLATHLCSHKHYSQYDHDDIVTRLRGYDFMRDGDIPDVIMNEAADEIERLRNIIIGIALNKQVWKGFNFD